jgi:hypothetical protein
LELPQVLRDQHARLHHDGYGDVFGGNVPQPLADAGHPAGDHVNTDGAADVAGDCLENVTRLDAGELFGGLELELAEIWGA